MPANAGESISPKLGPAFRILPEIVNSICQTLGIAWFDEHSSTGLRDHFRKRSMIRLNHRDAARHGLEQKQTLRLDVRRRHREDIEMPQKRNFLFTAQQAA